MTRKVSTHEISQHASQEDAWIVVNGKVYDVTKFAPDHPGGAASKLEIVPKLGLLTD